MLLTAEQLEIRERAVLFVAVFEPDAMPIRYRAVRVLPYPLMDELPIFARASEACAWFIRDLPAKISVRSHHDRTDRLPGVRELPFFKLSLLHASATDRPTRPAQSLVGGNLPFHEAMRRAVDPEPLRFLLQHGRQVLCAFLHAEHGSFSIDNHRRPSELRGNLRSRCIRIELSQQLQISGAPRTIVVTRAVESDLPRALRDRELGAVRE